MSARSRVNTGADESSRYWRVLMAHNYLDR